MSKNYSEKLNKNQREAVENTEGPLLVLAGAGAGKTKTIACRILRIIEKGTAPENILAITFTNKASEEMRGRVYKMIREASLINTPTSVQTLPFISTFHGLGARIIRDNSSLLEIKKHFSIYDRSDSKKAVREALISLNFDPKEFEPGKILSIISKQKSNSISIEEYTSLYGREYFGKIVSGVWRKYDSILRKENALDFDDLLVESKNILKKHPKIREHYSELWKYVLIDEYQDTNAVQYEISFLLSEKHKNICVVGDQDQNIYTWRSADIRNIFNFEKDFKGTKTIILEENYRSTKTILDVANIIIKKNKIRKEKKLITKNEVGELLSIFAGLNENLEAHIIAKKIKSLEKIGFCYSEIAVLYRANFQSRALEEAMLDLEVPYQVIGIKFFERKEVKDILSFIRYAINPEGLADLKRIINVPRRGIGKVTLIKMIAGQENNLPPKMKEKIFYFRKLIESINEIIETEKVSEVVKFVSQRAYPEIKNPKNDEEIETTENLRELISLSKRYDKLPPKEGVEKFLTDVSLSSDQDEIDKEDKVRLMTVHASKGLEFDCVFITGLEEGLFPHDRNFDNNVSQEEAEEERRLFYVALTRARKKIFLSYAQTRSMYGTSQINLPSEFILDIPEKFIEKDDNENTKEIIKF